MALKKQEIITTALELLNERGLEGVTLRQLAKKLNVQAPALYWHFKNKKALVTGMAEEILHKALTDFTTSKDSEESWQSWLLQMFRQLRQALLSYTDGGRVVAGAHLSIIMADFSERTMQTLVNEGVCLREARIIILTATRFTFGHVIEEQTNVSEAEMQDFHQEETEQKYPTIKAGVEEYFSSGNTVDDLFDDGLKLIIH